MKLTFLSISILFLSLGSFAQTQVWRVSDTLSGLNAALNMSIDFRDNLYPSGQAVIDSTGAAIVFKLDSSGVYHWSQGFVSTGATYDGAAGDTLGNTFMCGEYTDTTAFSFNAFLTRVDSSGNRVWTDSYNDAGYFSQYNNAQVDKAGNIWIAGTSADTGFNQGLNSEKFTAADSTPLWRDFYYDFFTPTFYNALFPVGDNSGGMYNVAQAAFGEDANSIVLLKYNSFGTFVWSRIFNSNPNSDEEPASGNADSLGNLYIADNSSPFLVNYNSVPYLIKMSLGDQVVWENLFGDTTNNYNITSSALDTAYFYIAGNRNDSLYMAKLSAATGDTVWTFVYQGGTGSINKITLKNGAIYGTGISNSNNGDYITLKVDGNGNLIWSVTYNDAIDGPDQAFALAADNSGNIYVAGQSFEAVGSDGSATVIRYHDNQFGCTLAIDSIVTINSTSNLTSDGAASVVVSRGTAPYNYNWSNGGSTDTITGLPSDNYCVTVTDSTGCIAVLCDSVKSTNLICDLSIDSVVYTKTFLCYNGSGTIFVYTKGSIGPVTYSIDSGKHYQPDYRFFNLAPGTYNIAVKDAHNCTAVYSENPITISQPFADTPTIAIKGDTLSTGSYVEYEWVVNGYGVDSTQTYINNQTGDTVNVYVLDSNGCIYSSDTIIFNTHTCTLAINSVSVTEVAPCYNGANGTITIHASGGAGQVSYSIDNGNDFLPDSIYSKLPAGTFNIEVKDTNNCVAVYSGNPVTITQPAADTPVVVNTSNVLSTGNYLSYSWYFNDTLLTGDSTQSVTAQASGYYDVEVTDSNHCSYTSSPMWVTLTGINNIASQAVNLTIYPNPFNETLNVSLDGNYNGSVEVQLFDILGQKLYDNRSTGNTFTVSTTGLAQGMYMLRVKAGGQVLYSQVVKAGN